MTIKQLSIFIENKCGRLTEVLDTLGQKNITIAAMSIADTSEYGIFRLIISDPIEGVNVLKNKNFNVNLTDVIGINTSSQASSFATTLNCFSQAGISIEYLYAFSISNKGIIIMHCNNRQLAFKVIEENNLHIVTLDDIFNV